MATNTNTNLNVGQCFVGPSFQTESVQEIFDQSKENIKNKMLEALISCHANNLNFRELAINGINIRLEQELSASDNKTKMVYQKLFEGAKKHISTNSVPLQMTLHIMNDETNNPETKEKFLGSFVLPETRLMIQRLQLEQPGSLECPEIWQ